MTLRPLLALVALAAQAQTKPNWRLPATIEVMRDVKAGRGPYERGKLDLDADDFVIKKGDHFQMIEIHAADSSRAVGDSRFDGNADTSRMTDTINSTVTTADTANPSIRSAPCRPTRWSAIEGTSSTPTMPSPSGSDGDDGRPARLPTPVGLHTTRVGRFHGDDLLASGARTANESEHLLVCGFSSVKASREASCSSRHGDRECVGIQNSAERSCDHQEQPRCQ